MKNYLGEEIDPVTLLPLRSLADFTGKSVLGLDKAEPAPEPFCPVKNYKEYHARLLGVPDFFVSLTRDPQEDPELDQDFEKKAQEAIEDHSETLEGLSRRTSDLTLESLKAQVESEDLEYTNIFSAITSDKEEAQAFKLEADQRLAERDNEILNELVRLAAKKDKDHD